MEQENFIILGNGLDISLGMKTSISEFLFWINKFLQIDFKDKFKISKVNFNNFIKFHKCYTNWCESSKKFNHYWNDLENNIIEFFCDFEKNFKNFKINSKGTWNKKEKAFTDLKMGYQIFIFLMQYYYVNNVKTKINKNFINKLNRLESFLNKEMKFILSLNYTNLNDFTHGNFKSNLNLNTTIYYLHYISLGLSFDSYLRNLDLNNKTDDLNYATFGNAIEIFKLKNINFEKNIRKKYIIPRFLSSIHCNSCNKTITGNKKYYQFLILGNSKKEKLLLKNKYNFLEKNDNNTLFLKNYPEYVLNEIANVVKDWKQNNCIYIFGYSFGTADYFFNEFLRNKILQDNWSIKYVFFNEDLNNEKLLAENMKNFNNFCNTWNLPLELKLENLEHFKSLIQFI